MGHHTAKRERNAGQPRAPQDKVEKDDEVHHAYSAPPDPEKAARGPREFDGAAAPSQKDAHGVFPHADSLHFLNEKTRRRPSHTHEAQNTPSLVLCPCAIETSRRAKGQKCTSLVHARGSGAA